MPGAINKKKRASLQLEEILPQVGNQSIVTGEQVDESANHKCSVFGDVSEDSDGHHHGKGNHNDVEQSLLDIGHQGVRGVHRVAIEPLVGLALRDGNNVLLGDEIIRV